MPDRPNFACLIAPLALLALPACSEGTGGSGADAGAVDAEPTSDGKQQDQSKNIPMTETGWLSVGSDGSVQTTFFDSGGRYRDYRNGELWGEGGWEQRPEGAICFEPDTGAGACWETEQPDDDSSIFVTDEDGKRVELKRVTYLAPGAGEDASGQPG